MSFMCHGNENYAVNLWFVVEKREFDNILDEEVVIYRIWVDLNKIWWKLYCRENMWDCGYDLPMLGNMFERWIIWCPLNVYEVCIDEVWIFMGEYEFYENDMINRRRIMNGCVFDDSV